VQKLRGKDYADDQIAAQHHKYDLQKQVPNIPTSNFSDATPAHGAGIDLGKTQSDIDIHEDNADQNQGSGNHKFSFFVVEFNCG